MTAERIRPAARAATFSELLRRHRRSARLTQEELAERAGLTPRGLRYLEQGTRAPYPDTVRRLVAALELVDPDAVELIGAARAHRAGGAVLPAPLPPHGDMIGRQVELAEALELLQRPRGLLTITGPGGVGKTRFAIELAEAAAPEFGDGVAWVPLAGVSLADEVAPAMLRALGGTGGSSRTEPESVLATLQDRRMLLLLDNFEHVAEAAELVGSVVSHCPTVKVLVTSRAPLRLAAEQEFWVAPLSLPSAVEPATPARVQASPAVQLFCERARSVDRHFTVDATNAADVAALCRSLEGLPLALELAATRIRVLPPAELVSQLADRLDLLSGGPLDAPARHRSLRSTLDWSHGLLDAHAKRLLSSISVFAGGCTFAALRAVCLPPDERSFNLVDAVDALQRNSLVQRVEAPGSEARYALLETVREYARERLTAAGGADALSARHAAYFAQLGIDAAARLEGPGQAAAAAQLEDEHDNLRAALQWFLKVDPDAGLQLAGELWMFWYMRGYFGEGRRYLSALLDNTLPTPPRVARAKALLGAGQLARAQADHVTARGLMDESIAAYQELGDTAGSAFAFFGAGFVADMQEDYEEARRYFEAALRLARDTHNRYAVALTLHHLGLIALELDGDVAGARALLEESLASFRAVGFPRHVALVLSAMGNVATRDGRLDDARTLHSQALELLLESGQQLDIHWVLEGFAELVGVEGDLEKSVRLAAVAQTQRSHKGDAEWGLIRRQRERRLSQARQALGDSRYQAALRSGDNISPEEAAVLMLGPPTGSAATVSGEPRARRGASRLEAGEDARGGV